MNEDRFWSLFVQCLVCKAVGLRQGMSSSHNCSIADAGNRRCHPYGGSPRGLRARLGTILGDAPQSSQLHYVRSSPTPTEIVPETEDESEEVLKDGFPDDGDLSQSDTSDSDSLFSDGPPLDSDPELPTVLQILRGEA